MYKARGGFLRVVVVGALLSVLPTSGFAGSQPTAEQRAACTGDYMRFCFSFNSNADNVVACLYSHKAQLSPSCRAIFDREEAKLRSAPASAAPPAKGN